MQAESSRPIVAIYRLDEHNIGDLQSAPFQYFDFLKSAIPIDIFYDIARSRTVLNAASLIVVGGGGMIGHCDPHLAELIRILGHRGNEERPLMVWWGAGNGYSPNTPDYLAEFDLVGIRDWPAPDPYTWVPCASCMHRALDAAREVMPKHETVVYDSVLRPVQNIIGLDSAPRIANDGRIIDIRTALNFIAQGQRVVTRSYHCAYWASLVGREVIVPDPFSMKFFGLRYLPRFLAPGRPLPPMAAASAPPDALEICRRANIEFAVRLRKLVSERESHRVRRGSSQ
jgi:hypothetical protein